MTDSRLVKVTLVGGQAIFAHPEVDCLDPPCCIHSPSDHHMRTWEQHWRPDRGIMERICPHGIGHPDPDDRAIRLGHDEGTHGCDGCCRKGEVINIEDVFTIKSTSKAPEGGHVFLCRPADLPKVGQCLVQNGKVWPILGVETFGSTHNNVGVLLPANLSKPEKGPARIEESS